MQILCLGLSHNTAPIDLRERLTYSAAALRAALARCGCGLDSRPPGVSEIVILSTCNRTELYACMSAQSVSRDPAAMFAPLVDFLAESQGLPAAEFEAHLYRLVGLDAVEHLCRVAGGLESMILGEPQILGQVTEACEAARGQGAIGLVLSALFSTAIRAGKRARTETAISRNPASVSSVAVRLAEQVVGDLRGRRVLVVGVGEMSTLAVEALRVRGVREIAVVNRTRQRAIELAELWSARVLGFEQLVEGIRAADIVIASTGAPHTLIDPAMVLEAMAGRAERLVMLDIAVPRDIDPAVGEIPGVHLFDIDQLQGRLEGAVAERQNEIPRVEAIVAEEVAAFKTWLRSVEIMPVLTDLRLKAERIRQQELARALRRLPDLDTKTLKHIELLTKSLVNKLMHEPTECLRAEASNGQAAKYAQTVRYLFGLASTPADIGTPEASD